MAEPTTKAGLVDEVSDLKDRIRVLEEDLKKERDKHKKDKGELTDTVEKLNDQMARVTRGLFFAGMETMALAARMTRDFVNRADERSTANRRDTWAKMMTDLPVDVSKAFVDSLEAGADDIEKIVDKFYTKYKE
jgi:hypothetical protein